jgi:Rad3-related DNA helicase
MRPIDLNIKNFTSFRPHQLEIAAQVYCVFQNGFKYALVEAPTGSGKTVLGITVAKLEQEPQPVLYIAADKKLQVQCWQDFKNEAEILMGRNNYRCSKHPELSADCCDKRSLICDKCPLALAPINCKPDEKQRCTCRDFCAYELQKFKTMMAPIGILNPAYYLQEINSAGLFSGRNLVIIDEADVLEQQLMEFIELSIPATVITRYNLQPSPKYKTKPDSWREWALQTLEIVNARISQINTLWGVEDIKEMVALERLRNKLQFFAQEADDNWVFDFETNTYRPIRIAPYSQRFIWKHAEHFLMMSATLSPWRQLASDLGIDVAQTTFFKVPSTFPPERNITHIRPVADMGHKNIEAEFPKMLREFDNILDLHPTEKGLCHCVSYAILKGIQEHSRHHNRLIIHNSFTRQAILQQFMNSTEPLVLLSPSFERGVDLKDDYCRFIILAKMPFGYLGDRQIAARLYSSGKDGRRWYNAMAARRVVQCLGRGMRSPTDYCTNYVLDSNFVRFYEQNKLMFPQWFRNTLKFEEVVTV